MHPSPFSACTPPTLATAPTRFAGDIPTGDLDHILLSSNGQPPTVTGYQICHTPFMETVSDHRIVSTQFLMPTPPSHTTTHTLHRKIDLALNNRQQVTAYQDKLLQCLPQLQDPSIPSEQLLKLLQSLSVAATHLVDPPKRRQPGQRKKYKDGFSPLYMAYKYHLESLVLLRRVARKCHKNNFQSRIHNITST